MVVTNGMILGHSSNCSSTLYIKVISSFPDDTPVLLVNGTRIEFNVIDTVEEHDNSTTLSNSVCTTVADKNIDDISYEMKAMTLSMDQKTINKTLKPNGLEKAYDSLIEMVSYPFIYQDWIETLGIECPKGILLYGPPGVGKTFLVSSVAKTCDAQLMVIQGPELYGPYVGESEDKLRQQFDLAQRMTLESNKPVILFIDEIDALTPRREQAQSHENRMVAQLLTLMDGVKSRGKLIVVGATNRPNAIDPALRRPGRFDREISVDAPDVNTRYKLITSQLRTMPLDSSIDINYLAHCTNGFVAADITSLCREAALHAVQRKQIEFDTSNSVNLNDFKVALSKVGPSLQRGFQVNVEATRWEDVGGLKQVKKQLKQAVEWPLIHKDAFTRLGLKPPRGILLYGPPGCSKTTLVKVIASSSGASFLSINGAQLYSPYVGDSEKVVRTTFQRARASAPAIIFLDETEAIVGKRNMGNGGTTSGDSVQERILSTLLNEMDGVESAESVLVVGATNRPDMLDAALMRPGRFDRLIYVPPPDPDARLEVLQIHTRNIPLAEDVDLQVIALMTEMYTGADLQNVCREAAMMALRRNPDTQYVTMSDFEESLATIPPSITTSMLTSYNQT
ncbi:P-loop containing nucleoside triphosphate hydrolase protein [Halteromyces radiatus]|uniref:P-loop containing nucleoside triphosphate hydrolase protein n=1 Tax=Halteromyces radiatus TaxID=101107 RepID=UPI002220AE8C|nr:P-loop containing nucleoside triphosphate hydrolase protein [Halteromyces radiatus]KAI8092750.1 P-loop containing nucleoside triphosphate hydrolase protein [Halteromyces radiatus]